jgi:hypothetical protein
MNDTENMMDENSAENLVVVSKLKTYIKSKAGMSTSGKVPDRLSHKDPFKFNLMGSYLLYILN